MDKNLEICAVHADTEAVCEIIGPHSSHEGWSSARKRVVVWPNLEAGKAAEKPRRSNNERKAIRHLMKEDGVKYTQALRKYESMNEEERSALYERVKEAKSGGRTEASPGAGGSEAR